MSLTAQLLDYVNACFTGLWVQTQEPDEAEREIVQLARQHKWRIASWDIAGGMRSPLSSGQAAPETAGGDPLAAVRALPALADPDGTALLILHAYHRFLNNPEVVQTVFRQLMLGKQQRTFLV